MWRGFVEMNFSMGKRQEIVLEYKVFFQNHNANFNQASKASFDQWYSVSFSPCNAPKTNKQEMTKVLVKTEIHLQITYSWNTQHK